MNSPAKKSREQLVQEFLAWRIISTKNPPPYRYVYESFQVGSHLIPCHSFRFILLNDNMAKKVSSKYIIDTAKERGIKKKYLRKYLEMIMINE